MAHRRSGFVKKIDTVHWTLISEATVGLAAGTIGFLAGVAQHLPETILRIRGEWAVALQGSVATGVGVQLAAGLVLVPEGTGTTVLWSPISDGDAPWIWWDVMSVMYTEQVTDVTFSSQTSSGRRVMDSKAMRKVRNRELQLVLENATIPGMAATTVNVSMAARVLSGT